MRKHFDSRSAAPDCARWDVRAALSLRFPLTVSIALTLSGCSSSAPSFDSGSAFDAKWGVSSSKRVVVTGPIPKGGGHYKLGKPYQIGGRWYVPRHEPSYDRVGVGSWYGTDFHGRKTANGEIFDMDALTAAHPTLPMPSYAYVTNLRNGRTILVRINDRGPYVADREIDLSRASAKAIGYAGAGLTKVRVRWAGYAPMDGNDRREQEFLRNQPWNGGPGYRMSERDYDPPPPREYAPRRPRYAQDQQRMQDAYDDRRYPPSGNYEPEQYESRGDAYRPPQQSMTREQYLEPPPPQAGQQARYTNNDDAPGPARYVEPAEQMAPAPDAMWSPFEHREQTRTVKRK